MKSSSYDPFESVDREAVVALVREQFDRGATPTELLLVISQQFGEPCTNLEFPVIMIMREALGLSLGDAGQALTSPLFGHAPLRTTEEFDSLFREIIAYSPRTRG
jgi:hypothetical protein